MVADVGSAAQLIVGQAAQLVGAAKLGKQFSQFLVGGSVAAVNSGAQYLNRFVHSSPMGEYPRQLFACKPVTNRGPIASVANASLSFLYLLILVSGSELCHQLAWISEQIWTRLQQSRFFRSKYPAEERLMNKPPGVNKSGAFQPYPHSMDATVRLLRCSLI